MVKSLIDELHVPRNLREKAADKVAKIVGSWTFIFLQTFTVCTWVYINSSWSGVWDPYPFVLMNVLLSLQAAYTAPIIMMSQNRQGAIDRGEAHLDYETNRVTARGVEAIILKLELQGLQLEEQAREISELKLMLERGSHAAA